MPRRLPIALLEDAQLKGRRPTALDIEAACDQLRRLHPDQQRAVVWLIREMAEGEEGEEDAPKA